MMLQILRRIAASVSGIPGIRAVLNRLLVAIGAAGFVEAISRILDPAAAKIMDGQQAIQQAIETGLETLRTTLISAVGAITGDPAAREKIDRLDEIARRKDELAELNAETEPAPGGPKDISAQVGLANEIIALEQEAAVPLAPGVAEDIGITMESADQAFADLDSTLEKVDKSMSKVFANMTEGGASAADELSRIFAKLDDDILGSLGKLGPGISRILGGGPLKFLGSFLGLAGGGAAQPDLPILVGERGPEIFLPSGPGRVLNAHNTARAMGGASAQKQLVVNQTNSFSTDIKNSVRAEVLNALPMATNAAVQQMANLMRGIRY